MTESELLTRNPQSTLHTPHQHSQQQLQQQPSTSLLLNPNVRLESRPETFTASNLINSLETNYHSIVERFGNSPLTETTQYLTNNIIDPKEAKHLIDGFLCGALVDAPNADKHFTCIKTLAISTDQWMSLLTSFNILTLECFPFMKHSCKQQLLYFIDETLKLQLRTNLDSSFTNICRALSDGTDFKETCQIVHQFAHRLLSSHQKLVTFPRNSSFPPTAFALFSRFISDAQLVSNAGVMNLESFKAPLVRERFPDLLQLGHDLFLLLLRLSRVSQFVPIWRTLLHNPAVMAPKFNGLQQLLSIPTSSGLLSHRVSLRISRKMAEILKNHIRISSLNTTNPSLAAQLKSELNKQFETLKAMHLSGPDSGSIRAEIIRHVWAFIEPKEFNPHSNEARATLLGWLLRTAKPGAELQWCKLSFFWEWFGFDPSIPNSHLAAEPVISTIRHLLNTGHTPLGNSLVDFLIKTIVDGKLFFEQVSPVFLHSKLDQILRDQFRSTFPDFFPKRLTSIADNLAAPSSIIDFEAIRKTTTNSSTSCTNLSKQLNVVVGGGITENLMENEKLEKNVLINGRVVMGGGGGSNVVSSSTNENKLSSTTSSSTGQIKVEPEGGEDLQSTSKRLPLTSLLPMVREEFREHLEGMFKAIKKKQNLSLEEAINSMQNLLDSIFDAVCLLNFKNKGKLGGEISEIMEQPLYRFFKTLCRSGEETDTRQFLLSILKKMMEECNRIARLTPYGPPIKVMRLICGSMNPRLLSRLMSEIVRENVVLFGEGEVLPMLVDSLKWDSLEQIMLWQMLQTEAVEFDKFIDLLQRLNYNQHPEATAAVIVIMRNMEPDPDVAIMKSLLRNLLLRSPNKDLFTVDAIKLLIDYDDNIPPVATCISKFVKKAVAAGDIKGPVCSPKYSSSFSSIKMAKNRILTAEYIFGHLDRLRKYCMEKESQRAENLLKNQLLLDMALSVKRNVKTIELRNKFDELSALFDILVEDEQATNGGKQQRRKANNKSFLYSIGWSWTIADLTFADVPASRSNIRIVEIERLCSQNANKTAPKDCCTVVDILDYTSKTARRALFFGVFNGKFSNDFESEVALVPQKVIYNIFNSDTRLWNIDHFTILNEYVAAMAILPFVVGSLHNDLKLNIYSNKLNITVFEINPNVVKLTEKWFDAVNDDTRHVFVQDGILAFNGKLNIGGGRKAAPGP
uniref:SOSS complex subunit A homolog n=1 Tax=Meloidogyne javanica TaxID=6303 RepID=A0A915LPM0_MELJA